MLGKPWPEQERIFFIENYALHGWQWVQSELLTRFGSARTKKAIQQYAVYQKCCRDVYGKWYTVKELVQMLELPEHTIKRAVYQGRVKARKANNLWLIAESSIDYYKQAYPVIGREFITIHEACRLIGVCESALIRAIERGSVKHVAHGRTYYVRKDYIEHIIKDMKQTGNVRVMWDKLRRDYEKVAA